MNRTSPKPLPLAVAAALLILSASSFAATDIWKGTQGDWNTSGAWNAATPTSADTAQFDSTGTATLTVGLAASGTALNISFTGSAGAYTIGTTGGGTLNLATTGAVFTDNLIAGAETINAPILLGSGASAVTYTFSSNSLNTADTLNFGGAISGSTTSTTTLTLNGNSTGLNTISGGISNGSSSSLSIAKLGTGTWVLSGSNSYTGTTKISAGTVILDYTTNSGPKLGGSPAVASLSLGGVNLILNGGSGADTVLSGTTNVDVGGQLNISRSSGSETINLGKVTQGATSGGAVAVDTINFQPGVVKVVNTTTNTVGTSAGVLLPGWATVGTTLGSYDFAAVDASGNVVTYSSVNTAAGTVNGYIALAPANNANTGNNFIATDSLSTGQSTINNLKIVTSSATAQTLTLTGTMGLGTTGSILNSASGNYTITGGQLNLGSTGSILQQWGAGTLEIDSNIISTGNCLYFAKGGSGTLILGGTNTLGKRVYINDGIISVANDANLGGENGTVIVTSTAGTTTVTLASAPPVTLVKGATFLGSTVSSVSGNTVTLAAGANATLNNQSAPYSIQSIIEINGGTLEATQSFSMTEGGVGRTINLSDDEVNGGGNAYTGNGGTIQVDSGVTLTMPGVITGGGIGNQGTLFKTGPGTLVASGLYTYQGGTFLNGGIYNLGVAQGVSSGPLGGSVTSLPLGTISFGGGTLQYSSVNTTDYSGKFSTLPNQAISIDTNGQSVTFASALTSVGGTLDKSGSGTLTLTAANTYTGSTTVESGTLAVGVSGAISGSLVLGKSGATAGVLDVSAKAAFSEANISGSGTINIGAGKTVTATGNVAPGFGVGTLNVNGNFTLASTAATALDVSGSGAGQFDLAATSGTFTYGGSLAVTNLSGYNLAAHTATYGLFTAATFAGDFNGPVTVNGVALADATGVWTGADGNGDTYTFTDSTGVLSIVSVPEPSTWAILLTGAGVLLSFQRARRRH